MIDNKYQYFQNQNVPNSNILSINIFETFQLKGRKQVSVHELFYDDSHALYCIPKILQLSHVSTICVALIVCLYLCTNKLSKYHGRV